MLEHNIICQLYVVSIYWSKVCSDTTVGMNSKTTGSMKYTHTIEAIMILTHHRLKAHICERIRKPFPWMIM